MRLLSSRDESLKSNKGVMVIRKFNDHFLYGLQLITGWRGRHERWIAQLRDADITPALENIDLRTILDLANGRLRPQYKLLRDRGYRVYGIDRVNRPALTWDDYAYKIARRIYQRGLQISGLQQDDTLVCGDVSILPFRDDTFDLVTSVAAFEHFLNVPQVVQDIHRVVRKGGVVWSLIHLFSSPSGGHNVSLSEVPMRKVPPGVDAWDHLRRRRLPFHVPLNEWRRDQYILEFEKRFEVLKQYCAMREGENLLTPSIEAELSGFSRDELTCGAYVIVARKPS